MYNSNNFTKRQQVKPSPHKHKEADTTKIVYIKKTGSTTQGQHKENRFNNTRLT